MGNEALDNMSSVQPQVAVLVVDDEESIRSSLEGILRDEGYGCYHAQSGAEALAVLERERPSLVLLDIWMPGMDGIETLKKLKLLYPDLPVIMISGHATIATAIRATKLGASDFIEKPLDLHSTLASIKRVLGETEVSDEGSEGDSESNAEPAPDVVLGQRPDPSALRCIAFEHTGLRGRAVPQKTLAHSALLYGHGVHTGQKSGLILEPLPAGSGIHFVGLSNSTLIPAHVTNIESTGYATTIRSGNGQAGTIEHLMSALHAYGVCNLLVKCNGEVPVFDGSAREFCNLFEEVGLEEQAGEWYQIAVTRPISVGSGSEIITIEPSDEFSIDYTLKYPEPVGEQRFRLRPKFYVGQVRFQNVNQH